jgi:hypothetical protein
MRLGVDVARFLSPVAGRGEDRRRHCIDVDRVQNG